MSKQVLEALLPAHNVRDELFLVGQRQPFVRDALMADLRSSDDGRYQRAPFENHLFVWGKLLVPAEPISGEHTCQS